MLIAGNWKMFKGAHEARQFATTIRHLPERFDRCRRRRLPAVRIARGDDRRPRADRDPRVRPERALGARGGVHGGDLRADAARARREGHARRPLRAATALLRDRRDGASAGRSRARGGSRGDRLRGRDGGASGSRARRSASSSGRFRCCRSTSGSSSRTSRSGRSAPGLTATPELAQEAHAFVKSLHDAPVLYGGSVKPENAASRCSRSRTSTARSSAAPRSTPSTSRRSARRVRRQRRARERPALRSRHPRRLGNRAARAGERGRAREHAGLRRALGALSARARSRRPAAPSACPRARWGTRRSVTSHSGRAGSSCRTSCA